jgi:hypothetical protein
MEAQIATMSCLNKPNPSLPYPICPIKHIPEISTWDYIFRDLFVVMASLVALIAFGILIMGMKEVTKSNPP